jgi:hypothetical protein
MPGQAKYQLIEEFGTCWIRQISADEGVGSRAGSGKNQVKKVRNHAGSGKYYLIKQLGSRARSGK